jgi:hypothetical protein
MDPLVAALVGGLPVQTLHTTAATAVADLMLFMEEVAHLVLLVRQERADKMVLQAHLALTALPIKSVDLNRDLAGAAAVQELQVQAATAGMASFPAEAEAAAALHAMATLLVLAVTAPMVLFAFGAGNNDLRSA